jgi:hypothetical protein
MDNAVLKKRLNTFKSSSGKLNQVSDEVVMDVLRCWENWPGTSADLYRDLGLSKMQLVSMLKKGKKLVKSGAFGGSDFKEILVDEESSSSFSSSILPCHIELLWDGGKLIRFGQVDLLLDFLKKAS